MTKGYNIRADSSGMRTIARGAEALVSSAKFLDMDAIIKSRLPKSYRDAELDSSLRNARSRKEARLLREARLAGVRTPYVYDVDTHDASITMEFIVGPKIRDVLANDMPDARVVCENIGRALAKLHSKGISHGDLTTSNMILEGEEVCLIDFSLGNMPASEEDLGVDIHLLRRAFMSAHSEVAELFDSLISSYLSHNPGGKAVLAKADEIQKRGRYT